MAKLLESAAWMAVSNVSLRTVGRAAFSCDRATAGTKTPRRIRARRSMLGSGLENGRLVTGLECEECVLRINPGQNLILKANHPRGGGRLTPPAGKPTLAPTGKCSPPPRSPDRPS